MTTYCGEAPGHVHAEDAHVLADMGAAGAALVAGPVDDVRLGRDVFAQLRRGRTRAVPNHDPGHLVAEVIGGGPKFSCAHGSQRSMWTSVPHTLAASTRISSSPGPGVGTGTSLTAAPGAAVSLTSARMVVPSGGVSRTACGWEVIW